MRTLTIRCTIATALIVGGLGASHAQEGASKDGGALVAELCTKCHNLDEVVRLRQSREDWEETVYSMVSRGAPIFPGEIPLIVDYLSSTYGPAGSR